MSALEKSKLVWDWLSKVNEGVSTQRDQRISVLRNLFNRFKRNDNENVQHTFDRLIDITNELQALGTTEITKHEVVKTLLRSLDSSFDILALMIQEVLVSRHSIRLTYSRGSTHMSFSFLRKEISIVQTMGELMP